MSVKKVPSGDNLMQVSYTGLKGWYEKSIPKTGAKGFFERTGKAIIVIPAHLLIGLVQSVFMLIYDLAMAIIFSAAALFTGFKKHSINSQAASHLSSLAGIPGKALKNIAAAFCPPCAYKSDNIRDVQYAGQFGPIWAKEAPKLKWDAYKDGYSLRQFNKRYVETLYDDQFSEPVFNKYWNKTVNKMNKNVTGADDKEREANFDKIHKKERKLSLIPFGDNLMKVSFSAVKSWYEASNFTKGAKGFFERLGKSLVIMPMHLLVGAVQSIAMLVYDLVMSAIFSIAAFFTGFTRYSLNRRVLGHLGSLVHVPGEALKHVAAAFAPPIAYRGENTKDLQYHFQYEKIRSKIIPQVAIEYLLSCNRKQALGEEAMDKATDKSKIDDRIRRADHNRYSRV